MNESWYEIRLRVPSASADLVCHELTDLGCEGITVEERRLDTFVPPDPDEVPSGDYCLKAYFRAAAVSQGLPEEILERLRELARFFPGLEPVAPELHRVATENWAEDWKQHFQPFAVGRRLRVQPSWETAPAAQEQVIVRLDPGMAFGTGTHGTTRLCLEALAPLFEEGEAPQRVLDVGTGSGILAIAAAALGSERVLACDIDPEACRTARENADRNGVGERVEVTGRPLEELEGNFDVILANILAEELVRLAPQLVSRLAPAGALILSGILSEKEDLVREGYRPFGLAGPQISRQEEWSCLLYRKG